MKLSSTAFEDNGRIPSKYTCEGDEVSPPLEIADVPEGCVSFAMVVQDPDAPSGDFVHWLIWNIDGATRSIKEGEVPQGAHEGKSDSGRNGWTGPCPPSGTHRYEFHLYALSDTIEAPAGISKHDLRNKIQACFLDEATLTGLYERTGK